MFLGNHKKSNGYGLKINWFKKFDLPSSFNLKKNKYKILVTYDLEIDDKEKLMNYRNNYSVTIRIENREFNGDQINPKKLNNWRKLKIFDFIL